MCPDLSWNRQLMSTLINLPSLVSAASVSFVFTRYGSVESIFLNFSARGDAPHSCFQRFMSAFLRRLNADLLCLKGFLRRGGSDSMSDVRPSQGPSAAFLASMSVISLPLMPTWPAILFIMSSLESFS